MIPSYNPTRLNFLTFMDLLTSIQIDGGITENGMTTNLSSLDRCVDLFFKIGASRKRSSEEVFADFSLAWAEDPLKALKILFLGKRYKRRSRRKENLSGYSIEARY